ncbi:hypothetical protein FV232_25000 [Methylobacterium sp. WL30]|uniref:hypothetical protein n=1 Tax=unclassified Methylobacterium TaxID=2615210 RepID=UPI0011CCBD7C|nr:MULTISPECIES: hypothetical protein [unclassified Methylobacterium]TXN29605.1 hypothetical protein FV225_20535 [Methylobacterium sp. WL93]TXN44259.1 hypothetical protein FV227_26895 [Methylobacterium sp. WL119]TXN62643.1 hypothetical protein FV232_25000 [Methylobacterium sp. WL30]
MNRSTVNKWEARGHLVMTVDGLVNVEASDDLLTKRPVAYRGGTAKGPVAAAPPSSAAGAKLASASPLPASPNLDPPAQSDATEVVIAALSTIVREIGACAARRAVEFGATLQMAFALDVATCLDASEIGERFLASIGAPLAALWSLVEVADSHHGGIVEADWPALAEAAGKPLDLTALEDWFSRLPNFDPPKDASHAKC